jgi:hypothetical protein
MPSNAEAAQATHSVAVIEVDVADPCPSTLVPLNDDVLSFVSSNASPAGYRWHELHVNTGFLGRETPLISSTLRLLMQARSEGRLADFRIVEGSSYLDMGTPRSTGEFTSAPPSLHAPSLDESNAAY